MTLDDHLTIDHELYMEFEFYQNFMIWEATMVKRMKIDPYRLRRYCGGSSTRGQQSEYSEQKWWF